MSHHQNTGARQRKSHTSGQPRQRPIGVMLIGSMCFVAAAIVAYDLYFGLLALSDNATVAVADLATLVLMLLLLPFFVVTGIGLLRLLEWGRYMALGFLVFAIGSIVVDAFLNNPPLPALLLAVSFSLLPAAMIMYLAHPSIRPAFRHGNLPM